jgi:PleD family two-component response regulator
MPHLAPYVVSQIILLLNAIGLVQLYFKEQNNAIKEGLEHITYLNLHDGLTGLYNKTYFDNKLQEIENKKIFAHFPTYVTSYNYFGCL